LSSFNLFTSVGKLLKMLPCEYVWFNITVIFIFFYSSVTFFTAMCGLDFMNCT
jgi:hypothetical protein